MRKVFFIAILFTLFSCDFNSEEKEVTPEAKEIREPEIDYEPEIDEFVLSLLKEKLTSKKSTYSEELNGTWYKLHFPSAELFVIHKKKIAYEQHDYWQFFCITNDGYDIMIEHHSDVKIGMSSVTEKLLIKRIEEEFPSNSVK